MPRRTTRHSNPRSTPMTATFSTASSAAADDFGGLSLASASASSPVSSSRHSSASPSPTPQSIAGPSTIGSRGSSVSSQNGVPKRKERQTRLQEHLRTVKPGSSNYSAKPRIATSSASKTLPTMTKAVELDQSPSSRPKRKAAQKVVMQEFELESDEEDAEMAEGDEGAEDEDEVQVSDEEEVIPKGRKTAARRSRARKAPRVAAAAKTPREREISGMSTVSAGIDVEGMDEDEVQTRLEKEKNELMERLAQHGINPQADVLDRALVTLSNSNEKLTVESFLRALSSLDSSGSPNSARFPVPLPIPPSNLSIQVPNANQAKRVSFSTLESPSTPSSSHSSIFPSPPSKSVSLPVSTPLSASNTLLPAFGSNGSISPSNVLPIPSTSASTIATTSAAAPSSLFGNSMPGMGRIALTRRHTYLGVPSASDPAPSLLPAFEPARQPFSSPAKPGPSLTSNVSKLQSWLDDDDSEEEDSTVKVSNAKKDEENGKTGTVKGKVEEEEMEIRVGGKTVKVLRKRQLEENDDDEDEEMKASTAVAGSGLSPKGKGKGKQRALECLCGESVSTEESSHGTVSCNLCETPFHLACLNVNSRRHLPLEWTCEPCQSAPTLTKDPIETPQKRARTLRDTTPPMSSEPTFVTSTFSPNPRGNFAALSDVALAPSPTNSPKRQFAAVPTSPILLSNSKVAIPATPSFGKDSDPRSDYSPCSPLFNRKSRSRLVSGVFDSAPFANDWAGDHFDSQHTFGDSLNPHDWHDITMTPSRGLGSSASVGGGGGGGGGVGGGGWETPFSSRSRNPSTLHPQTLPHHHRTPSQDIFSGSALDYVQGGRHTAPAQMFAQRLFGEDPASPSRINGNGSPLGSKRGPALRHGRNPSSSYILPTHAFASPSSASSIFSQFPPTPQSSTSTNGRQVYGNSLFPPSPSRQPLSSSAMKTSLSAPGMLRTGSDGLGIGYDDDEKARAEAAQFDDLLL